MKTTAQGLVIWQVKTGEADRVITILTGGGVITAYARSDGLWDIEGHLTDAWTRPVPRAGGLLPPGEPMHSMRLRLTVDASANLLIDAAE